jgi:hypothetical protein
MDENFKLEIPLTFFRPLSLSTDLACSRFSTYLKNLIVRKDNQYIRRRISVPNISTYPVLQNIKVFTRARDPNC